MSLLLEDGGRPDRNEPDNLVIPGDLGVIYGYPKGSEREILNGLDVAIIGRLMDGFFLCDVEGFPNAYSIHHNNLMHLDIEDFIVIDNYDNWK